MLDGNAKKKMVFALWCLSKTSKGVKINSRIYKQIRSQFCSLLSLRKGLVSKCKGIKWSEERKQKLVGRKHTLETKLKMRGRKVSDEIKLAISLRNKGKIAHNKGVKHTQETRDKIRSYRLGKKLSTVTKLKMSMKRKGMNRQPKPPEQIVIQQLRKIHIGLIKNPKINYTALQVVLKRDNLPQELYLIGTDLLKAAPLG
jgi:hypothetical protein